MPSFIIDQLETDDVELTSKVAALISGMAKMNVYEHYAIVRIENWFDDKWAGFGAVFKNYHEEFGRGTYDVHALGRALPPFAKTRIHSLATFGEPQRKLAAVFFFSTNNKPNSRASLVGSIPLAENRWEWYIGFKFENKWKAIRHRNISGSETKLYIEVGTEQNK